MQHNQQSADGDLLVYHGAGVEIWLADTGLTQGLEQQAACQQQVLRQLHQPNGVLSIHAQLRDSPSVICRTQKQLQASS